MTSNEDSLRTAFGRERIRSASKVVLGVGALLLVVALASLLPGVGRLLPESPFGVLAVAGALTALAVAALLVYLARGLATLVRASLDGPRDVVENLASIVHWVVVLFAVLVVHAGLGAVVTPVLGDLTWVYDVAFLLVALAPLTVVAARLYVSLDPAAELLADRLDSGSPRLDLSDPASDDADGS